jgi:hypothetical protein
MMKILPAANKAFFGVHKVFDLNGNLVRIQRSVLIITTNHAENNSKKPITFTSKYNVFEIVNKITDILLI